MKLGELLQAKRKELRFTQTDIANYLVVSPNYVSDVECCRKIPADFHRLLKWAMYLGISMPELLLTEES